MPSGIKTVTCEERIDRLQFLPVHGPHTSPNDIVPLRRQLEIMMNCVFKVGCRDCFKIQGSLIDDISALLFRFFQSNKVYFLFAVCGVGATIFCERIYMTNLFQFQLCLSSNCSYLNQLLYCHTLLIYIMFQQVACSKIMVFDELFG